MAKKKGTGKSVAKQAPSKAKKNPNARAAGTALPAQQDAAVGMFGGANWAPNLDNPQSKKFVAAYEAAYNMVPGTLL